MTNFINGQEYLTVPYTDEIFDKIKLLVKNPEAVVLTREELDLVFRGKCLSDRACESGLDELFGRGEP